MGTRDAVSVQAEIECLSGGDLEHIVPFHIASQIDIGGVVSIVGNSRASIPCRPYDICTFARMIADVCVCCTTDRVLRMYVIISRYGYGCHTQHGAQEQCGS